MTRPLVLSIIVLAAPLGLGPASSQCEVLELEFTEPTDGSPDFGRSVAIDGDVLVVGTPTPGATLTGRASVYERQPFGWELAAILVPSDAPETNDQFGASVVADGDRVLVGAPSSGVLAAKGAAYVFERVPGGWIETQKITNDDPQGWIFGNSVALEGSCAVVGARGTSSLFPGKGFVYVYEWTGAAWVKTQKLVPSLSESGDRFGQSVSIDGDRLVVGAAFYSGATSHEGRVVIFERNAWGTWTETTVLEAADTAKHDWYGYSVAVEGDWIFVGSPLHDLPHTVNNRGAVYVYEEAAGSWPLSQKLVSENPTGQNFGWSVAIQGDRAVVGFQLDDTLETSAGSAYLYAQTGNGSQWAQTDVLMPAHPFPQGRFGYSVALEQDELLVGAPGHSFPGHAHLFSLSEGPHLTADTGELSLSQGGAQELQIGACPEHEGDLYFLAGTSSGTSPGFSLQGFTVPLEPDAYLLHTLLEPNTPPLARSFLPLGSGGLGAARFSLPAGFAPSLAGLTLHHAYGVLDPATLALEAVSPPVPLALVP